MSDVQLPHAWVYWKTQWKRRTIARCHRVNTLRGFWNCFWNHHPSTLENKEYIHIFKEGIMPMWEDTANAKGGEIKVTCLPGPESEELWQAVARAIVCDRSRLYQQVSVLCTHDPQGVHRALCPRWARAVRKVGILAKVTEVTTVFPYTGLPRFLRSHV